VVQRIRFNSMRTSWVLDVDPDISVDELRVLLHDQQAVPMDAPVVYRGDALESGHQVAEYNIGTIPVYCFTEEVCGVCVHCGV